MINMNSSPGCQKGVRVNALGWQIFVKQKGVNCSAQYAARRASRRALTGACTVYKVHWRAPGKQKEVN